MKRAPPRGSPKRLPPASHVRKQGSGLNSEGKPKLKGRVEKKERRKCELLSRARLSCGVNCGALSSHVRCILHGGRFARESRDRPACCPRRRQHEQVRKELQSKVYQGLKAINKAMKTAKVRRGVAAPHRRAHRRPLHRRDGRARVAAYAPAYSAPGISTHSTHALRLIRSFLRRGRPLAGPRRRRGRGRPKQPTTHRSATRPSASMRTPWRSQSSTRCVCRPSLSTTRRGGASWLLAGPSRPMPARATRRT